MAAPTFVVVGALGVQGGSGASAIINFSGTGAVDVTGEASNDYAIAVIHKESTAAVTAPAGWNTLGTFDQDTGGFKFRVHVYGRRLSGVEAAQTWSWTGSTWRYAECWVGRGADPFANPVVTITGDEETAQNTNPVHPGLTITTDEAALVWFICNFDDIDNTTPPTGFAFREADPTSNARNILTYDDLSTVPGGSGTVSATLSGNIEWPLTILLELASEVATTGVGASVQLLPPETYEPDPFDYGWLQNTPAYYEDAIPAITGSGGISIGKPALAATGLETFAGTAAPLIRKPILAATGLRGYIGTATLLIRKPVLASAGLETFTSSGALLIRKPVLVATGASGDVITGGATLTIRKPVLAAAALEVFLATATLTIRKPVLAATGLRGYIGTSAITVRKPILAATGLETYTGTSTLLIRKPVLLATGASGDVVTGAATLTIRKPALAAAGLEQFLATAALSIRKPALAASGTELFLATASLTIRKPALAGSASGLTIGSATLTIRKPVLAATGLRGVVGAAALVIRKPALASAGLQIMTGSSAILIGAPALSGTGLALLAIFGTGSIMISHPTLRGVQILLLRRTIAGEVTVLRVLTGAELVTHTISGRRAHN